MRLQTESKPSGFVPATGLSTRRGFVLGTLGGTMFWLAGCDRSKPTASAPAATATTEAAAKVSIGEVAAGEDVVAYVTRQRGSFDPAFYKAVIGSVRAMTADMGMSARGITVSTVGLVPRIEQLTAEGIPVTLAVSLHAPDDELRDELVPINTRWKVGQVLDAAHAYFEATGRRVSIEYALIRDINDQAHRADRLADVLTDGRGAGWVHVNLIPLNPTPGSKWTASRRHDEAEFVRRLERHGVATTVRDTRGREIDGACGLLAASVREES